MNVFTLTAILTFLVTATSAQTAVNEASFTLTGDAGNGVYPSYNLTVPEDGSSVPIGKIFPVGKIPPAPPSGKRSSRLTDSTQTDNPLVVFSIEPEPESADYNCTFFGAEGSVTYTIDGTVDVDPPQAQVSVTCALVD